MPMPHAQRRSLAILCVLVLAELPVPERAWSQGGWTTFTAPDRSFSVLLPVRPGPPEVERKPGVTSHGWVVRTSYGGYVFAHSDYADVPDAGEELAASLRNFLAEVKGTVRTQRRISFRAARGDQLPALAFTFAIENKSQGEGRIVVDGRRAYMWVSVIRDASFSADSARYIGSFRIAAPAPR